EASCFSPASRAERPEQPKWGCVHLRTISGDLIMGKLKIFLCALVASASLAACGTLAGAAVGGAAGAAVGNNRGNGDAKKGAESGAPAGAIAVTVTDHH